MKTATPGTGLVTVMLGGPSAEREVSLRSGEAMVRALRRLGYSVVELDPRDDAWSLDSACRVVVLALHGTYGEDGTVQSRLETLGVPYTGCDAAASRLAFDKSATKACLQKAGVASPRYRVVNDAEASWPADWAAPLVVKPVRQGSSVGLSILRDAKDWPGALAQALRHDTEALVEEFITGRELTVGILGEAVLPVVEILPLAGAYDYQNKYSPGATRYECPAALNDESTARVQAAAKAAYGAIGGRDYGRVDVMLDAQGCPWVLEINTLPGMTETSLLPKAAAAAGIGFEALCEKMLALALKRGTGT